MNDELPGRAVDAEGAPGVPDLGAFTAFYWSSLPRVYGYLLHRCAGNASTAEDLTQETYLAAARELKRGSVAHLSMPWLIGVARHKLIDHLRRQEREERKLSLVAQDGPEADAGQRWEEMSIDEARAALASLPTFQRTALMLRYLDDLPVPEVAAALGRSVHATESLLARARSRFRRYYAENDDD